MSRSNSIPSSTVPAESLHRHLQHLLDSDRLGQVPGEVDVEALSNGEPVGHELERDDVEQTLEELVGVRNLDFVGLLARELLVVLVADDDGTALASNDLLVGVE
jgi:hypothetical protein